MYNSYCINQFTTVAVLMVCYPCFFGMCVRGRAWVIGAVLTNLKAFFKQLHENLIFFSTTLIYFKASFSRYYD